MARDARLFARLDLDYADHPKIIGLSDSAFRAHIEMILYARKYLTDGIIPKRFAKQFASESLSELLTNDPDSPSLVELDGGDYMLHGYSNMNETAEEVRRRSRANAENGRRGGLAKKRNAKRVASESLGKSLSETGSENVAETETETETDISTSDSADAEPRPEIDELLDYLDARIEANGARVPNRTKKNRDAARLLLDRDGKTVEQVKAAIDFATSDEFWRTNILSMSKLREKYDTLRMRATSQPATFHRPRPQQRQGEAAIQSWMFT